MDQLIKVLGSYLICSNCDYILPLSSPVYTKEKKILRSETICRCGNIYEFTIREYPSIIEFKFNRGRRPVQYNFSSYQPLPDSYNWRILCSCSKVIGWDNKIVKIDQMEGICQCGKCYSIEIKKTERNNRPIQKVDFSGSPLTLDELRELYDKETGRTPLPAGIPG